MNPHGKFGIGAQVAVIMDNEGGYTDHAADRGGPTNAGVTVPAWREYCADTGRNDAGRAMASLTLDEVLAFYWWWWGAAELGLKLLESPAVQLFTFDSSVLFGRGRAARWLQDTANLFGARLNTDGVVGPRTAAAVNALEPSRLVSLLYDARMHRHNLVVAKNPAQAVFAKGWKNRADKMRNMALEWARETATT
jgi:lysozyme family protein